MIAPDANSKADNCSRSNQFDVSAPTWCKEPEHLVRDLYYSHGKNIFYKEKATHFMVHPMSLYKTRIATIHLEMVFSDVHLPTKGH